MSVIKMLHEVDPREDLMKRVGDVNDIELFNTNVLVAVYVRPEKTAGGIMMTSNYRDEDKYQGKIGMLLTHGPTAFTESEGKWFHGKTFKPGDWLIFRPSDGWPITINGVLCRMLHDDRFLGRVPHPDTVF